MKLKTALWLDAEQVKKLKAIQKEYGTPMAESIRRAIDFYLEDQKKKK